MIYYEKFLQQEMLMFGRTRSHYQYRRSHHSYAQLSQISRRIWLPWFFNCTVEFADPENPALNRASKTCNNCSETDRKSTKTRRKKICCFRKPDRPQLLPPDPKNFTDLFVLKFFRVQFQSDWFLGRPFYCSSSCLSSSRSFFL